MRRFVIIAVVLVLAFSGCFKKKQAETTPDDQDQGVLAEANNAATDQDGGSQPASRISMVVYSAREYTTDGSKSNYDLFILDGARATPARLTSGPANDLHPIWSPDGTRIAYIASSGNAADIMILDPASRTTAKARATPVSKIAPELLFWPAANKIYFATSENNRTACWVLDLATGDTSAARDFVFGNAPVSARDLQTGAVSVSADCARVAKINQAKVTCVKSDGTLLGEIPLRDLSGTQNPGATALGPWSPDGSMLILYETASHKIYVADVKTGLLRSLADGGNAAWSADGAHVLYTSPETSAEIVDNGKRISVRSSDVYVIPASGGQAKKLTSRTCRADSVAAISVDGNSGDVDFAGVEAPAVITTATPPETPATPTEGTATPQFTADSGTGLALLGEFEANTGFIGLKNAGAGKSVIVGNRIAPVNGKKCEIKTYSLQNGKFGETQKDLGNPEDEDKYERKFDPPTLTWLSPAECAKTVGNDLSANTEIFRGGEGKIQSNGVTKRIIIYAVVQGENWETFLAVYRPDGNGWKQETTAKLMSGFGKKPTVNAGLKDVDGDGRRELLVAHHVPTPDDWWRDALKVFKIDAN
jgi:hypothetical protein